MAVTTRESMDVAALSPALATATAVGRPPSPPNLKTALAAVTIQLEELVTLMDHLPDTDAVAQLSRCEQRLATTRLLRVARATGSTGDATVDRRRARNVLDGLGGSARSIRRDARRAAAVASNRHLEEHLAAGAIPPEAIDALEKAADAKTGEIPVELVGVVDGLNPDQTTRIVERYLEDVVDPSDVEAQYNQQVAARRVHRYEARGAHGRPAMHGIGIEGPKAVISRLWSAINTSADALYQNNGGRGRPGHDHQPLPQRRFDALMELTSGDGSRSTGTNSRPSVVITIDANNLFDRPDRPVTATQLGAGPIPHKLLADYLSSATVSTLMTASKEVPLRLGRSRRRASSAQFLTLAVRDRGCVICRASIDRCVAHHLLPWTAPGRGKTDIENMALLCQTCHRDLHHRNHTLYSELAADGRRIWSTRPAEPHEKPAKAPRHHQRE